jgi:hypothetical protein
MTYKLHAKTPLSHEIYNRENNGMLPSGSPHRSSKVSKGKSIVVRNTYILEQTALII